MKTTMKLWIFISIILTSTNLFGFTMTEPELKQLYLDIVESSVDAFEPIWVDDSARIPNSGFFDYRKYPDWLDDPYATIIVIPGNGMVQFCYAVLLAETDKQTFGKSQIPREILLQHAIQSLRWCCLTSVYVEHPYPYLPNTRADFADGPNWRRRLSWRADEVGWLTLAAGMLWNQLDDDTRKQVEAVLIGGAPKERITQTWYPPQGGNHDQIKKDFSSAMGAAFLLPQRSDSAMYREIVSANGIDMVSTEHDFANPIIADGTPVSGWAKVWNLYPDYSSDHHGWCNLWYGCDMLFEGRSYVELLRHWAGVPTPETFTYPGNGFHGVLQWLKTLCLPEGEPLSPHGNEYDAYYGASLLAYCYGAVIEKDPVAAALEERAASLLQRHTRALPKYDYHRNSWAKASVAYLLHQYDGPRAEPLPFEEALRQLEGVYHYRSHQNIIHRSGNKIASFSWGSISSLRNVNTWYGNGLCGFIFPSPAQSENPEPFIYCHPKSLIGDYQIIDASGVARELTPPEPIYTYNLDDGNVHTTGVISDPALDRYYSFHSFDDGPCVLFTLLKAKTDVKVNWSGLPVYFYVREGLTGDRQLYTNKGSQLLRESSEDLSSTWWCVDDRIGGVFGKFIPAAFVPPSLTYNSSQKKEPSSTGQDFDTFKNGRRLMDDRLGPIFGNYLPVIATQRSVGYNWARKNTYKDQCDGVFLFTLKNRLMTAGDEFFLPAAFYTNVSHQKLSDANTGSWQIFEAPEGWSNWIVPDLFQTGKRYFIVSNFSGKDDALFSFYRKTPNKTNSIFEEGAPILSKLTTIQGKIATTAYHLAPLESCGEIIDLYAEVLDSTPVFAQKTGMGVYRFIAQGQAITSIRLRYRGQRDASLLTNARLAGSKIYNNSEDEIIQKLWDNSVDSVDIRFQHELTIDFGLDRQDRIAPAVEIRDIAIRQDKRVEIEVAANDRSGVQSVVLYCDDKEVGKKTDPPYIWTNRPGAGYHTYYAVATDGSATKNSRTSFKRTIQIEK